ncbi:MAG: EAL domain-containing protein [Pseudomonadales bacterium]|nr:EAL domain-containing protein [Pseudomonadales bacterium]MBO7007059.1 EAL domain-containing protein [Pseudomonadales bacterium]
MVPSEEQTEELILQEQLAERESKSLTQRAAVLRVYNYYRIVLAFLLMILFYEVPDQTFVGTFEPGWFQSIILAYVILNVAGGFYCLLINDPAKITTPIIIGITTTDLIFLTALMITSGGVESGLDSLLIFAAAFGGVMIHGQISYLFPSTALILSFLAAIYTRLMDVEESLHHFFEVALLGIAAFAVNALLQYVADLLKKQELEVVSLSTLERMRKVAEKSRKELEEQYDRFNVLLISTSEGVLGLNRTGDIIFANPRACELLASRREDLTGRNVQEFMVKSEDYSIAPEIFNHLEVEPAAQYDHEKWRTNLGELFLIDIKSEETFNKSGEPTGAVILFKNVTEERAKEEKLQYLANHDALTDLPNRAHFNDILGNAISRNQRTERVIAIMIVDLDHFTVINERLGQQTGDEILKEMAGRLTSAVRPGDLVARMAGDQFAVMLVDLDLAENASLVAEKIIQDVSSPLNMDPEKGPLVISTSIGIAVTGDEVSEADELLAKAVSAVESAKAEGRNQYRFFESGMQQKAEEKKRIQMLLQTAVDNQEFKLMYQPIVDIKRGRIASSEALIRWFPKDGDPIRPDIFIPIAEESGQINSIGSWVLESVSQQARHWTDKVGESPAIAINVSSKQLKNDEFRKQFAEMLETHKIPVHKIELELTETGVMDDPETCLEELSKLKALGVSISIDDFGTGYSSLDYLRRLPLDILKIDQSFTRGIGESENDEEIVRVMIRMAHAMGLKVICEGVETVEHLRFLQAHDCDFVQGYLFSRPQDPEDITNMILGENDGTFNIMDVH